MLDEIFGDVFDTYYLTQTVSGNVDMEFIYRSSSY